MAVRVTIPTEDNFINLAMDETQSRLRRNVPPLSPDLQISFDLNTVASSAELSPN